MLSPTPLAETARRLSALDPYAGFDIVPDPGDDWTSLVDAGRDEHLDHWYASMVRRHGRRNVAGSMLAVQLGNAVIMPTVAAMILDGQCPDPAVDNLAFRTDDDGHVERVAVRSVAVAAVRDDAAVAGTDGVAVADEAALHVWWAQRATATLAPLLAAVRARAPFSLRNLWGLAADEVTGTALWIGQLAGQDGDTAWRRARQLADAFTAAAPMAVKPGRPSPVEHAGGCRMFQVRGTCCLYYRSAVESGPPAETYCNTCPLRDDVSRQRRLAEYLNS